MKKKLSHSALQSLDCRATSLKGNWLKKFYLVTVLSSLFLSAPAIFAAPVVTSQPANAMICEGGGTSYSVVATGGGTLTYQWQIDEGSGFFNLSDTGVYSGSGTPTLLLARSMGAMNGYSYQCVVTSSLGGSANSNSASLNVNALPAVLARASATTVCNGDSVTLIGKGATWYSWNNGVPNLHAFLPSSTSTYIVTGTDLNGCSNHDSITIIVNPLPNVLLQPLGTVSGCHQPFALTGGMPPGGTYSGPGVNVNTGMFDPSIGDGIYPITYSYTDLHGCSAGAIQKITVQTVIPLVTFAPLNNVGVCNRRFALSGGSPLGGIYSGTGVSNGEFDPSIGVGTYLITYTYRNLYGCSASSSQNITVDPVPSVTLTSFSNLGPCSRPDTLTGGLPLGGIYTGTGVTNGIFHPSVGAGTYSITYTYMDANGCPGSDNKSITVDAAPVVTLHSFNTVGTCASPFNLMGGSPSGGTYSGTGVTNGKFDPSIGVGTYAITYLITDSYGCIGSASQNITVDAALPVTFSTIAHVGTCTHPFTLTGGSPSGGTYYGAGVTNGVFDPSTGPGTYTITYTYTDNNGCSGSATADITVNAMPAVTLGSFNHVSTCAQPFALTGGYPSGGSYYGAGVSNGMFDPSHGSGTYTITYIYTDNNGCSGTATASIVVDAAPTVTLGSFNAVGACAQPFMLTGGQPSGGTYSGTGVTNGMFHPSAGVGSYTITYTYNSNGCSGSASNNIIVNPLPTVTLSSFSNVCTGDAPLTLTGGWPVGGAYTGTGVSNGTFDPSINAGTYTITYTYTDNHGCSNSASSLITVNPLPQMHLYNFDGVCDGGSPVTLMGGSPPNGTYSGNGVSGGIFNPAVAGVGTSTITYSYTDINGCSNSTSSTITVNPLPTVHLYQFQDVCVNGSPVVLMGGSPPHGVYSGNGVNGGTFNSHIAGIGTTAITYTYTDANGCTSHTAFTITVNPLPNVSLNSYNDVCDSRNSLLLKGGWPMGGTYSGVGVNGGRFTPSMAGMGTTIITYAYTDTNGCSSSATSTITVDPAPYVTLDGFNDVCSTGPMFLLTGGSPAGGVYTGNGVMPGGMFDPSVAGVGTSTITYTYTDPNGCQGYASQYVIVTVCNGIEQLSAPMVRIYPNPTHSVVYIEVGNSVTAQSISVCDITGQELYRGALANQAKQNVSSARQMQNKIELDLSKYAKGVYFVRVNLSNSTIVRKLVVE